MTVRVAFILHTMQVAGAEVLVAETIRRLGRRLDPIVYCVDKVGALGEQMLSEGVPVLAFNRRPGIDIGLVGRFASELRRRPADVLHAHQYTPFFYSALAKVAAPKPCAADPDRTRPAFPRHHLEQAAPRQSVGVVAVRRARQRGLRVQRGCTGGEGRIRSFSDRHHPERHRRRAVCAGDDARRGVPADRAGSRAALHHAHRALPSGEGSPHAGARLRADGGGCARRRPGAGGGWPERAAIEGLVAELGLTGRVHFLGVRRDVPVVLRAADVFTLPSLSEGASITLMEAMAAGLPSVATGVGGMPEIMRDGVDGLLVPRQDPEKLAAAFRTLASDEALRARMGAAARARAEAEYRLDQTVARYMSLYERCMA